MATKAKKAEEQQIAGMSDEIQKSLSMVSKAMGVAVAELWSIFVRQNIVRGVSELFTAIVLCVVSYFLFTLIGLWILIPLAVALALIYDSIILIGNPKYPALEDVAKRIEEYREKEKRGNR